MDLLEHFRWGTTRSSVEKVLGSNCIPHPSKNAIGLQGNLYGMPSFTILYFLKSLFSSKLARVVITYDTTEMTDDQVEFLYEAFRKDIIASHGSPVDQAQYDAATPPEFRFSEMMTWTTSDSVIQLTKKLLRDGFTRDTFGTGYVAYDKLHDPMGKFTH